MTEQYPDDQHNAHLYSNNIPYDAYSGVPNSPQQDGIGFGVTSMILGIVALVPAFIPVIGIASVLLGIAAIILGVVAIKKLSGKGMGIAGIITGAISVLIAAVVTIFTAWFINAVDSDMQVYEDNYNESVEEYNDSLEEYENELEEMQPYESIAPEDVERHMEEEQGGSLDGVAEEAAEQVEFN